MKRFLISLISAICESAFLELLDFIILGESFDSFEYAVGAVVFFLVNIIFYKHLFRRK